MELTKTKISFVIPVYNEAKILNKNVERLVNFCQKKRIKAEILLSENGSTDNSRQIIRSLNYPGLKRIFVKEKGLGGAYRAGIKAAKYPIVYFTGMDFPFGYKNILDCYQYIEENDFVLASKAHPESKIRISRRRRLSSRVYRFFLKTLLGMRTRDAQGCAMFKLDKILRLLSKCDSNDAFFQTQLVLQAEKSGLKMIEIPVVYIDPRDDSKISVTQDGWKMFKQILSERRKIRRETKA